MRIGENLSPFWQNVTTILWTLGYGLTFVAAISSLWGWYVVGIISCIGLIVFVIDERKGIRAAFSVNGRKTDRLYALYLLVVTSIATAINIVMFSFLFFERIR